MSNDYESDTASQAESDTFQAPLGNQPPSHLARATLTGVNSYYRPKTFTSNIGINPLITAASPLLTLISRLRLSNAYDDAMDLYHHLVHEIKAFENMAQSHDYRSETILVARYVLCATLDETILNTPWGKQSEWELHKLLATFQKDSFSQDRFFLILDRISEDPGLHIDLLELMYLCLSLGFQGKYRDTESGISQLEDIKENLYQCIRNQRGEIKKELTEVTHKKNNIDTPKINYHIPIWLIAILTAVMLFTVQLGFNLMLGMSIAPISNELTQLQQETRLTLQSQS